MGKESKLRTKYQDGETRQQYANGDRKLYDKNACPSGCDENVWNLALYFTQLAEQSGWPVEGMPIVYTELYHRISRMSDLTSILDCDTLIPQIAQVPHIPPLQIVTEMIEYYFSNYYSNKPPSINDFTTVTTFTAIKDTVIRNTTIKCITNGVIPVIRTVQEEPEEQPSRRSREDRELLSVTLGRFTEEELKEKMRRFREGT